MLSYISGLLGLVLRLYFIEQRIHQSATVEIVFKKGITPSKFLETKKFSIQALSRTMSSEKTDVEVLPAKQLGEVYIRIVKRIL